MTRVLKGRLRKLEAQHKPAKRRHFIRAIGEADAERKLAALKASPEYQEGDEVLQTIRVIVRPAKRPDEGEHA